MAKLSAGNSIFFQVYITKKGAQGPVIYGGDISAVLNECAIAKYALN